MTVQPDATDEPIEVRRNAGLLVLVAFGSMAMAVAYGWRASQGSATVLWVVVAALVLIGVLHLVAWFDARAPLLVADVHGVRLRAGREWQGLTWSSIARVELEPKRGFLRDGRIVVVPEEDGEDLSLPIGLATAARAEEVVRRLTGLARDRTTVSVRVSPDAATTEPAFASIGDDDLAPGWVPVAEDADEPSEERDEPESEPVTDHPAGPVSTPGPAGPPTDLGPDWEDIPARHGPVAPAIHGSGRAVRAEVTRPGVSSVGMLALKRQVDELPEARELRGTDGRVGLVIESAPVLEEPVAEEAAVAVPEIEEPEWSGEPVSDPLIGPTLREARERLHLTVDSLAERTRIRPHVIESIEADDFTPCGGDFYARGHLRSLARVLGVEDDDLIRTYDAAYAQAPIEARRVFEAELATGPKPSIRLTSGGPNWAALVGVVLVLAIIWGAAQYFTGGSSDGDGGSQTAGTQVPAAPTGDPDPKGDLAAFGAPTPNRLALSGRGTGSRAVVRTSDGSVVWRGTLAKGQDKQLEVPGKATVEVKRGPGVDAQVNGEKPQLVGGRSASKAVLGKK